MTISQKGIDLIKRFEGCKLEAYPDPATGAEPITIGWGSTLDEVGNKFKLGDTITQERADALLYMTVHTFGYIVAGCLEKPLNQNQFDSIVSFAYNVGLGNFKKSTLLKKINNNPADPTIKDEFMKWTKARVKGKLVEMEGLKNRRSAEAANYSS